MVRSVFPAALLFLSTAASAQITWPGGNLPAGTTTWSGNVTLNGDATVPSGATLVIQPGTVVTAAATDASGSGDASRVELVVQGTLNVAGVAGGGVTFTGAGSGNASWGGIRVEPGGAATISRATLDELNAGVEAVTGAAGVTTSLTFSDSTITNSNRCFRTTGSTAGTGTYNLTNVSMNGCALGGVNHATGSATLTSCAVQGAPSGYHGAYVSGGTLTLDRTVVSNNAGSGVSVGGGNVTIDRSTIAYNGSYGVYTYVSGGTTTVTSSIISHNSGTGAYRANSGTFSISASNLWGNSATFGPPPTGNANVASYNYSNVAPVSSISANPLYVDGAAKNFRLTSQSPSRGSGAASVDQGALPFGSDATAGVQGTFHTNTTLSGSLTVLGDLTVAPGVTLTLQPGTTLTFAATDSVGGGQDGSRGELIVLGTLTAVGVAGQPITFTGAGTGVSAWGGVTVAPGGNATLSNVRDRSAAAASPPPSPSPTPP
jgi:hypothetical protein